LPTPLFVLLIRHGESQANAEGRFAFRTWDPPLTETGRAQAESLVEQLETCPIVRMVSSPLRRARETMEPLAAARGLAVEILPELAELDMGRWDGAVLKEIAHQDPANWQAWRQDPEANPPPRGERISMVGTRVLTGLDRLRGESGLVVAGTHADCVKGAMARVLGLSGPSSRRLVVPNLGQVLLRASDDGGWRIVLPPALPQALWP
jgi:broad specificity phosphatase PhoE